MIFFGVGQLHAQDVTADVVLVQLAQLDAFAQRSAHLVLKAQVGGDHLGHGGADVQVVRAHARGAFEHENAAHQGVGVLCLFFHLVVDTLVELAEAPVFVHARVDEVLVTCRQFARQQRVEIIDYVRVTLHCPDSPCVKAIV